MADAKLTAWLAEKEKYKLVVTRRTKVTDPVSARWFSGMRTVRHSQSRKHVGWILNGAIQIFRSLIKSLT